MQLPLQESPSPWVSNILGYAKEPCKVVLQKHVLPMFANHHEVTCNQIKAVGISKSACETSTRLL